MAEIETTTEARQGRRGRPVLYVLIGSLALLAIYMVGMLTWSGTDATKDHASQSQDSARELTTGSVNGNKSSPAPTATPAENPANPVPAKPNAQ
ncbi:hypothetical protein [Methylobacterium organophilum]|uniref:Uncharacterized protein n=1 Tax=Methylobacterium organophilum TaxID=410 RepID=A0ABQ4TDR2_METOR|nr:hypothetical protein [Methylobacterium organophilum]UMY18093.1 hypothetical protein MMB17_01685 [Methylobacterium organophilum]GJE28659.1 hypothetical protein LKMONMHP_3532 [Methylobacterium organophilum]